MNALGRHLLLELFDCDSDAINNLEAVKTALVEAARRAQATIVDVVFHEFNPFGVSGVVIIAESHLSIHTWPEYRYAAVDVFSCGDVLQPQVAADYLVEQFGASRASVVELQRGIFVNHGRPLLHKPAGTTVEAGGEEPSDPTYESPSTTSTQPVVPAAPDPDPAPTPTLGDGGGRIDPPDAPFGGGGAPTPEGPHAP